MRLSPVAHTQTGQVRLLCVRAGADMRNMRDMLRERLSAGMHGASAAADEALRLLLDAGYGDGAIAGDAGVSVLIAAAGCVALVCNYSHGKVAVSSSCTLAPWCGVVSSAIKLARRVTRRLRRALQAAAPRRPQLRHQVTGGATQDARGAAVDDEQSMLEELLGLAAGAAGALIASSGSFFTQAPGPALSSFAVSPAELHLGAPRCAVL